MSLPAPRHWFSLKSVFQAFAFTFAEGLGVLGLRDIVETSVQSWLLIGGGGLALVAWYLSARDEKRAEESGRQIEQLVRSIQRTTVLPDTPIHLQDLTTLSNPKLKELVGKQCSLSRALEAQHKNAYANKITSAFDLPNDASQDARDLAWKLSGREMEVAGNDFRKTFADQHRPNLVALLEEVERRTGQPASYGVDCMAIRYGSLAGPHPIEDATIELERAARALKDDREG